MLYKVRGGGLWRTAPTDRTKKTWQESVCVDLSQLEKDNWERGGPSRAWRYLDIKL